MLILEMKKMLNSIASEGNQYSIEARGSVAGKTRLIDLNQISNQKLVAYMIY